MNLRGATIRNAVWCACLLAIVPESSLCADEPGAEFYRGVNLNGPAVTIDGNAWQAMAESRIECRDSAFENQAVELVPPTDPDRAAMIRSSTWAPDGNNSVSLGGVESGSYRVFLYVWEDNDSQTFDVILEGRTVAPGVQSGSAGQWQRLGPWDADVSDGRIDLASRGGHANFSGVEVWRLGSPAPTPPSPKSPRTDDPIAAEHFDHRVAPLIASHCLGCHNADDKKGGLVLARYDSAMAGGDSGPVVAPGNPEESLLWRRVDAGEMPPESPLSDDEKQLLLAWVADGAKWGADPIDPFLLSTGKRAGYDWWSLQPLASVEPPLVNGGLTPPARLVGAAWVRNPIDQFVLAKLEAEGLGPSPEADRRTLIRRLSFDLIGLPPSPDEVAAFIADSSTDAYERLVDRLLDSPHYGERWARRWLDIVRFGESQGFERNKFRTSAWKYRDWVVESFNADLPYDEFARQQIAGDVLSPDDPLSTIASGFLVVGPYDLTAYTDGTPSMKAAAREEEIEGLVGAVGQTFLGLTINCARCHDHKFDPVSQREYYQFAAAVVGTYHGDERESLTEAGKPAAAARVESLNAQAAALREQMAAASDPIERDRLAANLSRNESLARLLGGGPAHVSVPKDPGVTHILARGDFRQPGEPVAPAGLVAVTGPAFDWGLPHDAPEGERRRALAAWVTDHRNPLFARAIVNRLWGYHFGAGIVATPSDFGFNGARPSHPELLDWLANELISPERSPPWSLKRIHRLIVTAATYRQQSRATPESLAQDSENRRLWRYAPQRLEAETLRDAVLTVTGQLDRTLGGPGFRDFTQSQSSQNELYEVIDAVGPEFDRRTLYRTWIRTGTSPFLDVLDCPDPSVATPRRSVTTTPLQALTLLNSGFMERAAQAWADRLAADSSDSQTQVAQAYQQAYARMPDDAESAFAAEFITGHGLAELCLVLLNANEFLFVE